MNKSNFQDALQEILSHADIKINGDRPWDIQVHDDRFYHRVLAHGTLGMGESYMDGWWDCEKMDEMFYRALRADLQDKIKKGSFFKDILIAKLTNLQSKKRSSIIGEHHYDLGNKLYEMMLDTRMVYSCAYWKDSFDLDEAQRAKLELSCKKLYLKPGMKVLDIGCGWGSFAKYAAEMFGVSVVGITVSKEQVELGGELCRGLPVEIKFLDYRDIDEKFDAVVSIGMFEHVGHKNYKIFMKKVYDCLNDDGLFLLHTIGRIDSAVRQEPWIDKYIFPNSITPTAQQITEAAESLFIIEDWHNFGIDYYKTVMAWYKNFLNNWDKLKEDYDDRFKRMWEYYLLSCGGGFKARKSQLYQIVFSKKGVEGGYKSIR